MKVGLIGCGAIGTELAKFIDDNKDMQLIGLADIDEARINNLKKLLRNSQPESLDMDSVIEKSELVIEAASQKAAKELLIKIKDKEKKAMFMSTGGLIGSIELLKNSKSGIYVPSGAVSGIDGVKAASIGKIKSVSLTTTKHPNGLKDAPYVKENNIDISAINKKKAIFKGNLEDAIKGFPQNINVAATLSIASNFKKLKVKIVADPNAKTNTHEIRIVGDAGKIKIKTENVPSPANPKTSYLAVLSAIATLKQITENARIGT